MKRPQNGSLAIKYLPILSSQYFLHQIYLDFFTQGNNQVGHTFDKYLRLGFHITYIKSMISNKQSFDIMYMNKKRVTETRIVLLICLKETNSLISIERVALVCIDAGICGNLCHSCTFKALYIKFSFLGNHFQQ